MKSSKPNERAPNEVDEGTRKSMRANRSTNTKPELILRKALWAGGVRGYRKNVSKLPGKPDIVFPSVRLCIFVHGCFWHGCPTCSAKRNLNPTRNSDYWLAKRTRNQERDRQNSQALQQSGWKVIVVWECQIQSFLSQTVEDITETLPILREREE
jgi:DNA mismatch endonuclease (patch repair protein)